MAGQKNQQQALPGMHEFWAEEAKRDETLPPFLSREDKEEMIESREVFTVFRIREGDGGLYGPEWRIDLFRADGTVATLTLSQSPGRDPKMLRMMAYLDGGSDRVIPATLVERPLKNGKTFLDLAPPEVE